MHSVIVEARSNILYDSWNVILILSKSRGHNRHVRQKAATIFFNAIDSMFVCVICILKWTKCIKCIFKRSHVWLWKDFFMVCRKWTDDKLIIYAYLLCIDAFIEKRVTQCMISNLTSVIEPVKMFIKLWNFVTI